MTEEQKAKKAHKQDQVPRTKATVNENALYLLHNMDLMALPPVDVRICKPQEISDRVYQYFETCINNGMKPSFGGLCIALSVSRSTMIAYLNEVLAIPSDNLKELQKAQSILNALMEDYMQNGKINPVAGIFLMKNDYGYKDQQEFVVNNRNEQNATPEMLIEEAQLLFEEDPKTANLEG